MPEPLLEDVTNRPALSRHVPRRHSVSTRYLIVVLSLLTVALVVVLGITVWSRYRTDLRELERDARDHAGFVGSVSPEAMFFRDFLTLETLARESTKEGDTVYVVFIDTAGGSMTRFLDPDNPLVTEAITRVDSFDAQQIADVILRDSLVEEVREPIVSEGVRLGEIRLGYSTQAARATAGRFALQAAVTALVIGAFLVVLSAAIFEWLVKRPLHRLTSAADALAAGQLDERVSLDRRDEIGALQSAFNDMADELQATLAGLARAKDEAEAADRAKSDFLANMSHEIRTPLNAVLGLNALVLESDLDDDQRDLLTTMHHSGDALLELINGILDLSKLNAGSVVLERRSFEPRRTVASVVDIFAAEAGRKDLELRVEFADAVPRRVIGDETRLRQVLLNLVGNAVKFTEKGHVSVTVRTDEDRAGGLLRFAVRDTGIGLDPDHQQEIFEPFQQGDSSTTRRFGGTGLGLAICDRLVSVMGGRLDVESTFREGSTFDFAVPLPVDDADQGPGPVVEPLPTPSIESDMARRHPLRVLLAEDNVVNQKVAVRMLAQLGYAVDVANDGAEAVDLAARGGYDVVLMDLQMPEIDGISAARLIREALPKDRWPAIVAFTAHALEGDRERYLEIGMSDYVAKPVRIDLLAEVLERVPTIARAEGEVVSREDRLRQVSALADRAEVAAPEVFDVAGLKQRFGGDAGTILAEVLPLFREDTAALLKTMETAIAENDARSLVVAAHTLKGSARIVGVNALAASCEELERVGREGPLVDARMILATAIAESDLLEDAHVPQELFV